MYTCSHNDYNYIEIIKSLLTRVYYSESGSSELEKEKSSYMLFLDLLYDCEDAQREFL